MIELHPSSFGKRLLTPFFLGLAFLCVPFYRILFYSDRVLLFRDLVRDYLPQKMLWANAFREGSPFPFWNHHSFGGTPFWAMNVGSPLHPFNFFFLLFPSGEESRALAFFLFFHYVLFYWGCYRLFRFFQLQPWPATLFALSLASSGLSLSLHSLGHVLVSMVSIPWFFYFLFMWQKNKDRKFLFLPIGAFMAWPIYGGDPQISYFLAIFFVLFHLFHLYLRKKSGGQSSWLSVSSFFCVGISAFFFSAAQLLPTAELALQSARTTSSIADVLLFSFHPIRLLEFFFPLFFGNRLGFETYWAEQWVNFPYKNPFVFSAYPGIFFIWIFISNFFQKQKHSPHALTALIASISFLILSFGDFSPIPLYQFFAEYFPLFPLFRYPERLLVWTLFFLTAYLVFRSQPNSRSHSLGNSNDCSVDLISSSTKIELQNSVKNWQPIPRIWVWLICLFGGLACIAVFKKWIPIPLTATIGIVSTCIGLLIINECKIRWKESSTFFFLCLGIIGADLIWNQTYLVWDVNKHVLDLERNSIVREIKKDIETRSAAVKSGASFRVSPDLFSPLKHSNSYMDHISSTTHGILDSVSPNVLTIYGLEDISGYFSFVNSKRIDFWNHILAEGDPRHYFDLMGAYYLPKRNQWQISNLSINDTAQPYLFAPETLFFVTSKEELFSTLRSAKFQTNRDVILQERKGESINAPVEQGIESGNFRITKRDGKRIQFQYFPKVAGGKKFIQINESFDKHWVARVNGQKVNIIETNGWAMGIWIHLTTSSPVEIELEYRNPWIFFGLLLTALWWIAFLIGICIRNYIHRNRTN